MEISLVPHEHVPMMAQALLGIFRSFPTWVKVGNKREDCWIYNPQQLMRRFDYYQGTVIITKLASSSALVVVERFVGLGTYLAGMEIRFQPRLAHTRVKSLGVLYWQKCRRKNCSRTILFLVDSAFE